MCAVLQSLQWEPAFKISVMPDSAQRVRVLSAFHVKRKVRLRG